VGAKPGQSRKSGRQRLALIIFAALFVVIFAGFAIADGLSQPSVPAGDVAMVKNVPDDVGSVSEAEFKRALVQQAAQAKLPKLPKQGEKKYEELKTAALNELLDGIWLRGEAEEQGITLTKKQVATELAQIKKTSFKTKAAFAEFLKSSRFTLADVIQRVELQVLSTQIQEAIAKNAPQASDSEIAAYYESAKDAQYTTAATRDIRVVVTDKKPPAEAAKAALDQDNSPANWKKVATKYSTDPVSKAKGGLQPGISEELLKSGGPLKTAIFGTGSGVVSGPVEFEKKFYVIEVVKLNPAKVQSLDEVKSQIKSQLSQQLAQEVFTDFVSEYQGKWQSRTFCAGGYVTERCANYKPSGHAASADPACYEANPKGGLPKECPAPVAQAAPALPGTTTILKPQGERLPQRPRPEDLKAGAAGATTLPEGVTPTTGTAPTPEG
jgi:parvulin-like peptidyl-prolyl isomerase